MELKLNKVALALFIPLVLFAFSLSFGSAFGIAQPYWKGYDLQVYPGMSVDVPFELQNRVGTEDVIAKIVLSEGSNIASLSKTDYIVDAGDVENVVLKVKIPSNAVIGEKYTIRMDVQTQKLGEAGSVGTASGFVVLFDAAVGERPSDAPSTIDGRIYIIGAIVLLIVVLVWFMASKKKSKKK